MGGECKTPCQSTNVISSLPEPREYRNQIKITVELHVTLTLHLFCENKLLTEFDFNPPPLGEAELCQSIVSQSGRSVDSH